MTAPIILAKGSHDHRGDDDCGNPQRCFYEWYNWITRQEHTDDRPPGVSPVLHQFGMSLNDCLPDDRRQQLVRFLPNGADRLAGTEHDGKDEARGYLALDWLIRVHVPAWLELAGLTAEAAALRDLRRIDDLAAAEAAGPVMREASSKAAAAWDAAGDAAWAAAGAAAGDAAWDAAWAAAWAAARDAAGAAAGAAAWAAAWAAARAAAGAAAWAAARAAADKRLAPTVAALQDRAVALYDAMITGEQPGA